MSRKKADRIIESQNNHYIIDSRIHYVAAELSQWINPTKKLTLELGCGRGEHTLALANIHPGQQYIGVDYQGERLWYGAQAAQEKSLNDVRFIRSDIHELGDYLKKYSVDHIWITFPDPHPKQKRIRNRLTHPDFLKIYKALLKKTGMLHLKTDNEKFFNYSLGTITQNNGYILEQTDTANTDITSYYEERYRSEGKKIYYLKARLS